MSPLEKRRSPRLAHFVVAFALAGCSKSDGGAAADAPKAVKAHEAARVRTTAIEAREMVRTISTTTTVESEREIRLFPRESGVVTSISAEEGDTVAAGAVLAELDRRTSAAQVEEARVAVTEADDAIRRARIEKSESESRVAASKLKLEQSQRELDRNEKAGLISAQQLDNLRVLRDTAQNDLEAAKLAVERVGMQIEASETQKKKAEIALRKAELDDSFHLVTAPFAGVIAARSIKAGDMVGPTVQAFVLTDLSALRCTIHRPQRELGLFLDAQKRQSDGNAGRVELRASAEALPGRTFVGEIALVSPAVDPQSGSFRVTVKLPPSDADPRSRLLPGMLLRLDIVTERHPNALAVPKRALRREGETAFVFVVEGGVAHRVAVKEGFSDDDSVEVLPVGTNAAELARLAAGRRVVVVGNRELEDGAEVAEEAASAPSDTPVVPAPAASSTAASGAQKG